MFEASKNSMLCSVCRTPIRDVHQPGRVESKPQLLGQPVPGGLALGWFTCLFIVRYRSVRLTSITTFDVNLKTTVFDVEH
jgi:hypothetical protein